MNKTLGGSIFIRNAIEFDYCIMESVKCLQEFCDEVVVLDAGSTDNTLELLYSIKDNKTKIIELTNEDWYSQHGREKVNYFTNLCIEKLTTDFNFNLQADEIVHEKSYDVIRKVINSNFADGFMCTRFNLWGSPYTKLNVPHERMPCSPQVLRLAKTKYKSCGDGESLEAPYTMHFVNEIKIWHYGFIRKKEVMKSKIINMQRDIFNIDIDAKLHNMDVFDSTAWFAGDDLEFIEEPHPKIMKEWIKNRP